MVVVKVKPAPRRGATASLVVACLLVLVGSTVALGGRRASGAPAPATTTTSTSTSTTTWTVPPTTAPPPAPPPPPPPPAPGGPPTVLVVGDSVADGAAQGLAEVAGPTAGVADRSVWGCGVAEGGPLRYFGAVQPQPAPCDGWPTAWTAAVDQVQPRITFVLVGRWELMDRVIPGHGWAHIGEPVFDERLVAELERAVAILSARGGKVALATTPYYRRGLRPDGGLFPEDEPGRVDRYNQVVREVAARHPWTVRVVDVGGRLTPGGFTRVVDGVTVRPPDGVHLSADGRRWLAAWLLPQLVALAQG